MASAQHPRERPTLLFLSHRLPYPPHNGAAVRTLNILRLLAGHFHIVGLCFDRRDPAIRCLSVEERLTGLAPYGRFRVYPIPQDESRMRFLWDHLRSVLANRAYTAYLHDSKSYDSALADTLKSERIDLVHMDSMDLVRFLPRLATLPVVCTHHNVESGLLLRRARAERNPLRRAYLAFQAQRLRKEEQYWLPRVALNIAVSDQDRAEFERIAPGARVATLPNGVDTEMFRPEPGPRSGCVFVGGTTWFPNRDALEWFVQAILPIFRQLEPETPVVWVGRATEEERRRLQRLPGFQLTGYVDDIRPYVHRAACFIAPLRVGGGTRLKILDAWAMGKAVVSTPIGCEGLAAAHGENILLATTPQEFAEAMARVVRDPGLAERLGTAARRTVERLYSWEVLGERLRELYLPLVRSRQVVADGSAG